MVAAAGGGSSGELEFALFVRHQTGPGERVVPVFGHQVPREDGQFAAVATTAVWKPRRALMRS